MLGCVISSGMQRDDSLSLPFLRLLDGIILNRASLHQLLVCTEVQFTQKRQGRKLQSSPVSPSFRAMS